jgi:hypothetical protein
VISVVKTPWIPAIHMRTAIADKIRKPTLKVLERFSSPKHEPGIGSIFRSTVYRQIDE